MWKFKPHREGDLRLLDGQNVDDGAKAPAGEGFTWGAGEGLRHRQFAFAMFDGDFPERYHADGNRHVRVGDRRLQTRFETGMSIDEPNKSVGVQKH